MVVQEAWLVFWAWRLLAGMKLWDLSRLAIQGRCKPSVPAPAAYGP